MRTVEVSVVFSDLFLCGTSHVNFMLGFFRLCTSLLGMLIECMCVFFEQGSGISPRSALIRSWGRASLCVDSAQCGRQEVFGVENNIK